MSAARHEALCSELGRALKAANGLTFGDHETDSKVFGLASRVHEDFCQWRYCAPEDLSRADLCFASTIKHSLILEHKKFVDRCVTSVQVAIFPDGPLPQGIEFVSVISLLPGYFAFVMGNFAQKSQTALKESLLDHDYISFMANAYLILKKLTRRGVSSYGLGIAAGISLLSSVILTEESDLYEEKPSRLGSIAKWRQYEAPKRLRNTLKSKEVDEFLLLHLSVGLRQLLPPDQALPGTLARISGMDEGILLRHDPPEYFLHS
jgi:hypothetical protein